MKKSRADQGGTALFVLPEGLQLDGDGFDFGVLLKSVLTEFAPQAGLLESAKRRGGVEDVVAVYPDGTRTNVVRYVEGLGHVLRPDRGGQAVHVGVGPLDKVVQIAELEDAHDGPEDLFLGDLHGVLHIRK